MSKVHHLKANDIETRVEVSSPTLTVAKIHKLLDESQEQIKQEYIDDIKDFFERNIEELTGQDITSVSEYIADNMPEHLYEYISFAIDILSKALR